VHFLHNRHARATCMCLLTPRPGFLNAAAGYVVSRRASLKGGLALCCVGITWSGVCLPSLAPCCCDIDKREGTVVLCFILVPALLV
jgi:hypothetical protein